MVGQRFGKQVVLRDVGDGKVEIQCDCGRSKTTRKQYLLDGSSRSCGCGRYADRAAHPVGVGEIFGKLTVDQRLGTDGHRKQCLCLCSCGTYKVLAEDLLRSGHAKSCGCLRRARMENLRRTHGESGRNRTMLYNTWLGMLRRTSNPEKYPTYANVKVHPEWRTSFEAFRDHLNAELGARPKGMSLDRIDNNGHYEPGNVRWLDPKSQTRNRSSNVLVSVDGVTRCLAEWAEVTGISTVVISARLRNGWSREAAVTTPARPYGLKKSKPPK